jgi:hypothetical protein
LFDRQAKSRQLAFQSGCALMIAQIGVILWHGETGNGR